MAKKETASQYKDKVLARRYGNNGRGLWWKLDPKDTLEVSDSVTQTIRNIRNQQKWRDISLVQWGAMYQGPTFGYGNIFFPPSILSSAMGPGSVLNRPPKYNLTYSITETLANRISKSSPKVTFLTDGGDFSLQKKAKMLDDFSLGIMYQTKAYELGQQVFKDACIFGTGVLKSYIDQNKNLCLDRVMPACIWVDALDGKDRKPRSFYEVQIVDKDVLAARFKDEPNGEEIIDRIYKANAYNPAKTGDLYHYSNLIWCYEATHLPSAPGAEDGRHIICLQGEEPLVDEPYERDRSPYTFFRFADNTAGQWGMGVAELIMGHQRQLDRMIQTKMQAFNLISSPRIWVEQDSGVNANTVMDNGIGTVGFYRGTPPVFMTPQAIGSDFTEECTRLVQDAFQYIGVSQLSASSQKPQGLDSGEAIRTYSDIEADRFSLLSMRYENMFLELAEQHIDLARIAWGGGGYKVKTIGKSFTKDIDWKDINLAETEYKLKLWPTSLLPKSPSGQLAAVQELLQAGLLDKDTALGLLNFPDLKEATSYYESAVDDADRLIQLMEDGDFEAPDPQSDLQLAMNRVKMAYRRGKAQGQDSKVLDRFIRYNVLAAASLQAASSASAPPQPSGAPPAPMAPTGQPAPAPVSPLMAQGAPA